MTESTFVAPMRLRPRVVASGLLCWLLLLGCPVQLAAYNKVTGRVVEYEYRNSKGSVVIRYKNESGYKIVISITSDKNRVLYSTNFTEDLDGVPGVDFRSINDDGIDDVMIKLRSEGQYRLLILLSKKNGTYVEALPPRPPLYFDETRYTFSQQGVPDGQKKPEYRIMSIDGNGGKEIVFDYLTLDRMKYKNVVLRLDRNRTGLVIARKQPE